ncbi:hypothetical protein RRG08_022077 [Elysia crispata]|uniref:Uncharacterized protein n=1 Tax=Elysia crispata TaxID=231223 RepID=A0AAE0Y2M6_9GAST|nr:hypothetical protein RRG08_022077 [Elysia crispata]
MKCKIILHSQSPRLQPNTGVSDLHLQTAQPFRNNKLSSPRAMEMNLRTEHLARSSDGGRGPVFPGILARHEVRKFSWNRGESNGPDAFQ